MIDTPAADPPKVLSAYFKLPRRHQLFVDAFIETGIQTEAVRRIKPKCKRPDALACKLMARPEIQAAIKERSAQAIYESGVNKVEILKGMMRIAKFDPRKLKKDGKWQDLSAFDDDTALALGGIKVTRNRLGEETTEYLQENRFAAWREMLRYVLLSESNTSNPDADPLADQQPVGKIIVEVVGARTALPDDPATG